MADSASKAFPAWTAGLKRFERPDIRKASIQILNTVVPYLATIGLMYLTIHWNLHYGITLLLAVLASSFLARLFIFFHDCAHGSYLPSPSATKALGIILGIFVFMPFFEWRKSHALHHATSGNLDRRGTGDIWTMTVEEYYRSSRLNRFLYRMARHPVVMFGFGPLYIFLLTSRLPRRDANRTEFLSVILTNIAIASIIFVSAFTIGIEAYLLIQLPIILMGGAAGIWLFYIQHQFDPTYWSRKETWNPMEAALRGSSFYKLPKILQWISGNIGFHHIHHLRPRIPNYNLEQCLKETPELQLANPLTLKKSFKAVRLNLWDEQRRVLVSFREASPEKRSLIPSQNRGREPISSK